MKIIRSRQYVESLFAILEYIAEDKVSAAKKFQEELDRKINVLRDFPKKYRASYYFKSDEYRDMIHHGYTVIYKVKEDTIEILDIFKWQNR